VDEATSSEFMTLAREAREPGWWTQYGDLKLDPYLGLEQAAASITTYTMHYFPALLQTEDYARAVIKAMAPKIDPLVHEQRVEARLRRQQLLESEDRPRYRVLLDEAVLNHRFGSPMVMIKQIDKILDLAHEDKATLQIIPFELNVAAAQDSNFVLFEFGDDADPTLVPMVFVEGLTAHQYMERKADIARYREAIDYLRDSALSPRDSLSRIAKMKDVYAGEVIDETPT
jgi:hypothetical protein